jgi:hypothetical protein
MRINFDFGRLNVEEERERERETYESNAVGAETPMVDD